MPSPGGRGAPNSISPKGRSRLSANFSGAKGWRSRWRIPPAGRPSTSSAAAGSWSKRRERHEQSYPEWEDSATAGAPAAGVELDAAGPYSGPQDDPVGGRG